jgi:cellobiose transport system permease protein
VTGTTTTRAAIKRHRHFYLFVAPFFILFAVFGLYPLIFSLVLSFVRWDGLTDMRWVGSATSPSCSMTSCCAAPVEHAGHRAALHPGDADARVPAGDGAQRVVAARARLLPRRDFRPCVTPMVVIAIVFGLIYSTERGLLNYG